MWLLAKQSAISIKKDILFIKRKNRSKIWQNDYTHFFLVSLVMLNIYTLFFVFRHYTVGDENVNACIRVVDCIYTRVKWVLIVEIVFWFAAGWIYIFICMTVCKVRECLELLIYELIPIYRKKWKGKYREACENIDAKPSSRPCIFFFFFLSFDTLHCRNWICFSN